MRVKVGFNRDSHRDSFLAYFLLHYCYIIAIVLCPVAKGYCQAGISPDAIRSMLIKDRERAKAYTQDYMKAMPAKNYGFKATDSIRSFAQQLLHVARSTKFFVAIATITYLKLQDTKMYKEKLVVPVIS